jgi:hypothetical protein
LLGVTMWKVYPSAALAPAEATPTTAAMPTLPAILARMQPCRPS